MAVLEKLEILKSKKKLGDLCLNVQASFDSELLEMVAEREVVGEVQGTAARED